MLSHKKQFESTALWLKSRISKADTNKSVVPLTTYLMLFQNLVEKFIFSFCLYMKMTNFHPKQQHRKSPEDQMLAEFLWNSTGYTLLDQQQLQGWRHGVVISLISHFYKSFIVTAKGIRLHGLYITPCRKNSTARKGHPRDKFGPDRAKGNYFR